MVSALSHTLHAVTMAKIITFSVRCRNATYHQSSQTLPVVLKKTNTREIRGEEVKVQKWVWSWRDRGQRSQEESHLNTTLISELTLISSDFII